VTRRRAVILSLLFGALPSLSQAQTHSSVACGLDGWNGRFVPGGFVEVSGWAVDEGARMPVTKMEVFLDGSLRGDVNVRGWRPDVGRAFGEPAFDWSAWRATVSLARVLPGRHAAEVFAYSRSGERLLCARDSFEVRPFFSPSFEIASVWATLVRRAVLFLLWLTLAGWGIVRIAARWIPLALAPAAGLALFAVGIEIGSLVGVRPLAAAGAATLVSLILVATSSRHRPLRVRRPRAASVGLLLVGTAFLSFAALPLASHGPGAVVSANTDAAWECSIADSIARFGWSVPQDVQGFLQVVPSRWRHNHVRGGSPYLLALLSQLHGCRAHEVHSVLGLALGCSILFAVGALASRAFRAPGRLLLLAPALVALNSVPLANLYGQHLALLAAVVLYLLFLFQLVVLTRSGTLHVVLPMALAIAAEWTLYPEAMALWVLTALVASGSAAWTRRRASRVVAGLTLACLLASAINPIGLTRSVQFTLAQRRAKALATAAARLAFGDMTYFPSLAVVAGTEPLYLDAPETPGKLAGLAEKAAIVLLLLIGAAGAVRSRRRERMAVLLVLAPVAVTLAANRWLDFPYGASKALAHAVPVWALALGLLAAATGRVRPAARWYALLGLLLVLGLSLRASMDVANRAVRAVPGYDAAYASLPGLMSKVGRDAVVVIDEPAPWRFIWVAYFAGENWVLPLRLDAPPPSEAGERVYRLLDLRVPAEAARADRPVAAGPFFALIPADGRTQRR
jgi:hypothetical protein